MQLLMQQGYLYRQGDAEEGVGAKPRFIYCSDELELVKESGVGNGETYEVRHIAD